MNDRREKPDNHSILTDDACDRIAGMLFPHEPIRACTPRDSWLINHYHFPGDINRYRHHGDGPKTFPPDELISEVDRAYFRLSLMLRVFQWFEEKGIDIDQPTIPKNLFEAAVQAEFGQLPPAPAENPKRTQRTRLISLMNDTGLEKGLLLHEARAKVRPRFTKKYPNIKLPADSTIDRAYEAYTNATENAPDTNAE